MRKTVLVYGVLGGLLITVLELVQYRYLVLEHSVEISGGIVAAIFSALGIWLVPRLSRPRQTVAVREAPVTVCEPRVPRPRRVPQAPQRSTDTPGTGRHAR